MLLTHGALAKDNNTLKYNEAYPPKKITGAFKLYLQKMQTIHHVLKTLIPSLTKHHKFPDEIKPDALEELHQQALSILGELGLEKKGLYSDQAVMDCFLQNGPYAPALKIPLQQISELQKRATELAKKYEYTRINLCYKLKNYIRDNFLSPLEEIEEKHAIGRLRSLAHLQSQYGNPNAIKYFNATLAKYYQEIDKLKRLVRFEFEIVGYEKISSDVLKKHHDIIYAMKKAAASFEKIVNENEVKRAERLQQQFSECKQQIAQLQEHLSNDELQKELDKTGWFPPRTSIRQACHDLIEGPWSRLNALMQEGQAYTTAAFIESEKMHLLAGVTTQVQKQQQKIDAIIEKNKISKQQALDKQRAREEKLCIPIRKDIASAINVLNTDISTLSELIKNNNAQINSGIPEQIAILRNRVSTNKSNTVDPIDINEDLLSQKSSQELQKILQMIKNLSGVISVEITNIQCQREEDARAQEEKALTQRQQKLEHAIGDFNSAVSLLNDELNKGAQCSDELMRQTNALSDKLTPANKKSSFFSFSTAKKKPASTRDHLQPLSTPTLEEKSLPQVVPDDITALKNQLITETTQIRETCALKATLKQAAAKLSAVVATLDSQRKAPFNQLITELKAALNKSPISAADKAHFSNLIAQTNQQQPEAQNSFAQQQAILEKEAQQRALAEKMAREQREREAREQKEQQAEIARQRQQQRTENISTINTLKSELNQSLQAIRTLVGDVSEFKEDAAISTARQHFTAQGTSPFGDITNEAKLADDDLGNNIITNLRAAQLAAQETYRKCRRELANVREECNKYVKEIDALLLQADDANLSAQAQTFKEAGIKKTLSELKKQHHKLGLLKGNILSAIDRNKAEALAKAQQLTQLKESLIKQIHQLLSESDSILINYPDSLLNSDLQQKKLDVLLITTNDNLEDLQQAQSALLHLKTKAQLTLTEDSISAIRHRPSKQALAKQLIEATLAPEEKDTAEMLTAKSNRLTQFAQQAKDCTSRIIQLSKKYKSTYSQLETCADLGDSNLATLRQELKSIQSEFKNQQTFFTHEDFNALSGCLDSLQSKIIQHVTRQKEAARQQQLLAEQKEAAQQKQLLAEQEEATRQKQLLAEQKAALTTTTSSDNPQEPTLTTEKLKQHNQSMLATSHKPASTTDSNSSTSDLYEQDQVSVSSGTSSSRISDLDSAQTNSDSDQAAGSTSHARFNKPSFVSSIASTDNDSSSSPTPSETRYSSADADSSDEQSQERKEKPHAVKQLRFKDPIVTETKSKTKLTNKPIKTSQASNDKLTTFLQALLTLCKQYSNDLQAHIDFFKSHGGLSFREQKACSAFSTTLSATTSSLEQSIREANSSSTNYKGIYKNASNAIKNISDAANIATSTANYWGPWKWFRRHVYNKRSPTSQTPSRFERLFRLLSSFFTSIDKRSDTQVKPQLSIKKLMSKISQDFSQQRSGFEETLNQLKNDEQKHKSRPATSRERTKHKTKTNAGLNNSDRNNSNKKKRRRRRKKKPSANDTALPKSIARQPQPYRYVAPPKETRTQQPQTTLSNQSATLFAKSKKNTFNHAEARARTLNKRRREINNFWNRFTPDQILYSVTGTGLKLYIKDNGTSHGTIMTQREFMVLKQQNPKAKYSTQVYTPNNPRYNKLVTIMQGQRKQAEKESTSQRVGTRFA